MRELNPGTRVMVRGGENTGKAGVISHLSASVAAGRDVALCMVAVRFDDGTLRPVNRAHVVVT